MLENKKGGCSIEERDKPRGRKSGVLQTLLFSSPKQPHQEKKKEKKKRSFSSKKKNKKTKKADTFSHFEGGPFCAVSLKTKRRSSRREKKTRAPPPPPPFLRPAKRAQRSTSALERLFGVARARGVGRSGARGRRGERDFETRFLFCVCAFFLLHDEINWAARHPLWNTFVIPRSLPNNT